jgi:hypothetical protein
MQTIAPVNVHVENAWRNGCTNGSYVKKNLTTATTTNRGGRQAPRVRTCVTSKIKTNKTKPCQQIVQQKQVVPVRSRSPSPNREPW